MRVAETTTASTTTLRWEEPEATGGCPISGYALYRNDPDLSDPVNGVEVWIEVNSDYDTNIRDKPQLFEGTVTNYPVSSTGTIFKYTVEAFNAIGGTRGTSASYLLATLPSAPPLAPGFADGLTSSF